MACITYESKPMLQRSNRRDIEGLIAGRRHLLPPPALLAPAACEALAARWQARSAPVPVAGGVLAPLLPSGFCPGPGTLIAIKLYIYSAEHARAVHGLGSATGSSSGAYAMA